MGVAGPSLAEAALGVDGTKEELGSARFQTTETGMADLACEDDEACSTRSGRSSHYLPRNARRGRRRSTRDRRPSTASGCEIIPSSPRKGRHRRDRRGDRRPDSVFELKPTYARNIVTAFARSASRGPIGVIANNPGSRPEPSILAHRRRRPTSRRSATPTARSSRWPTYPESCPARTRNAGGSLATREAPIRTRACDGPDRLTSSSDAATASATWRWAAAARSTPELTVLWPTAEVAAMGIEGPSTSRTAERSSPQTTPRPDVRN